MNENQGLAEALQMLPSLIDQFSQRFTAIEEENAALKKRLGELENVLYEDIVNPAIKAMDDADREDRFTEFNSKYGDSLGKYNDQLKKLEGDENFDLTRTAFNDFDNIKDKDFNEDEYVEALTAELDQQLQNLREALGVSEDSEVTVTSDPAGTEVTVNEEPVVAEPAIEEATEEPVKEEEEPVKKSEAEELAELEKELQGYL